MNLMNIKLLSLIVAICGVFVQPVYAGEGDFAWENGGTVSLDQGETGNSDLQDSNVEPDSWFFSPITWAGTAAALGAGLFLYMKSRAEGGPAIPAAMVAATGSRILEPDELVEFIKTAGGMAKLTVRDSGLMPGWGQTLDASKERFITILRGLIEKT